MSSISSENSDSDEERERNLRGKLFNTINQNNYTSLKQLFQTLEYEASSIVDAKDKNDNNNTLLQKAIKSRKRKINVDDNTRIIELLLHHGADPEATNDFGDSAYGLLEKRSKKYTNDVDWIPIALHNLARSQFPDLVCLADEDGHTILHYAAAHGGKALLTLLSWFKDNHKVFAKVILLQDKDLHTALHVAIMSTSTSEHFKVLLNLTRDILGTEALSTMLLIQDSQGLSMLYYSCKYTSFCNVTFRECKLDLLNYAKKHLDDSSFQKLISLADVTGKNILHYSSRFKPENCMDYVKACDNEQSKWDLLTAGDSQGKTPLHYMLAGNCSDILKELTQVVDKNSVIQLFKIIDKNQRTPLHIKKCGPLCRFQDGLSLCQRLLDSSAFLSLLSISDSMNQSIFIFSFLHLQWGFSKNYLEFLTQNYTLHMLQPLLNHVTNKRQNFLHMALQQKDSIDHMKIFLEFLAKVFPNFAEIAKHLVAKDVNGRSPITCPCFDTHLKTYKDDFAFFTKMITHLA